MLIFAYWTVIGLFPSGCAGNNLLICPQTLFISYWIFEHMIKGILVISAGGSSAGPDRIFSCHFSLLILIENLYKRQRNSGSWSAFCSWNVICDYLCLSVHFPLSVLPVVINDMIMLIWFVLIVYSRMKQIDARVTHPVVLPLPLRARLRSR